MPTLTGAVRSGLLMLPPVHQIMRESSRNALIGALTLVAAVSFTYLLLSVKADSNKLNAGIVFYTRGSGGVQYLLADHTQSNRGWAAFSGRQDGAETPAETAARETEEETHGYFSRATLLKRIQNQRPFTIGRYHVYFLQIDRVPAERIMGHRVPGWVESYTERGPYAWIPASEVIRALATGSKKTKDLLINPKYLPTGTKNPHFWDEWIENLRAAQQAGVLPK